MKKYLLAIISLSPILLAIGTACSVTNHKHYTNRDDGKMTGLNKRIPLNYTNCDDGKMTGLNKRIPLSGYYSYKTTYQHSKPGPEAGALAMQEYLSSEDEEIYHVVIFYEDGTECAASTYSDPDEPVQRIKKSARDSSNHMSWGRYRVNGDTIKVQFLIGTDYANSVIAEDWYRINKDATISYLAQLCRQQRRGTYYYDPNGFSKAIPQKEPCAFTPTTAKPDSMLSTLRRKKWYKCK